MDVRGAEGNVIEGYPSEHRGCSVVFRGRGHQLTFGANVRLRNAKFRFLGKGAPTSIVIGDDVFVNQAADFDLHATRIVIGNGVRIIKKSQFIVAGGATLEIGAGCLLANVRIRTNDMHKVVDVATGEWLNPAGDVVLEPRVWLAEDVKIYKGVRIGEGSVVGACSVVTSDLPAQSLCVGVPARVVRQGVTWA
ncbi:acyltransferase [Acuticoccus sp.]|uniref:acyltransferase n=1 Tax=Acuticoccus sp. TaxID=1904378 RepID=UPI003B5257D1